MYPSAAFVNEIVNSVTQNIDNVSKSLSAAFASMPGSFDPTCPYTDRQAGSSSSSSSTSRPPIPGRGGSTSFPRDDEIMVNVIYQPVKDTYTLKKSVSISTVSGAMKIDVVPSPTPSTVLVRKLNTQTVSGAQTCTITSSLGPFLLDSTHSAISGAIKLSYPADWCGTIELSLMSGSYKLDSSNGDVRVVSDVWDRSAGERKVVALKGNPREGEEFSTLKVRTKSGAIKVNFENKPQLRDMTAEEVRAEEQDESRRTTAPTATGKEDKERRGPAVTRAATTETTNNAPVPPEPSHPQNSDQNERASVDQDLPPSYEQSEAENVLTQLAGRD